MSAWIQLLVGCLLACALFGTASLASAGSGAAGAHAVLSSAHRPRFSHVFEIVLENREYSPPHAPAILGTLSREGVAATNYYAIAHPSVPNYLALIAGDTFGVHDDTTSLLLPGPTLIDQLESAGLSWKAYMDGMPRPCFLGVQAGRYVRRHDPFLYFARIRSNGLRCRRVQPLTHLKSDLREDIVPNFSWITPDLCHDGHDCAEPVVNSFLSGLIRRITVSSSYRHDGLIVITYDEGTSARGCCQLAHGGHVAMVMISPDIRHSYQISTHADHYSLLRTIEDNFGLAHLRGAACRCTAAMVIRGTRPVGEKHVPVR